MLVNLPLFHYAAMYFTLGALAVGARIAVRATASLDQYWEVARDTGATIGYLLSTMVPYLLGQPARPAEREHRLRLMNATPLPVDIEAFQKRFGIADITTGYGATEVPGALCRVPGQPLVPSPGAVIDFAELLRHCVDNLPHFAVPRYFQLIDALPKTASARVQKYSLRERGNTADTWDREQHGLTVTRDGLVTAPRRRSALCPFLGPARAELQCAARPEFLDLVVC